MKRFATYFDNIFIITLISFFILLFIFYIIDCIKNRKTKEGFDMGDVGKIVGKIDDVVNMAGEIPKKLDSIDDVILDKVTGELNNVLDEMESNVNGTLNEAKKTIENSVLNKIDDLTNVLEDKLDKGMDTIKKEIEQNVFKQITNLANEIKKNTIDLITNKLTSIFSQIGNLFEDGIIKPFTALFEGLGNIFVQLFNIIKMIGNKIASLPSCSIVYGIKSCVDILYAFYKGITPSFLEGLLSPLYDYTFGIIFGFIGYLTGYSDAVKKCYGFNVNDELDKMNNNAKNIQKAFVSSWGLDFSKIKI